MKCTNCNERGEFYFRLSPRGKHKMFCRKCLVRISLSALDVLKKKKPRNLKSFLNDLKFELNIDFFKKTSKKEIAETRQIIMFLMRKELKLSYKKIAYMFGKKSHATVLHATNTVSDLLEVDKTFKSKYLNTMSVWEKHIDNYNFL